MLYPILEEKNINNSTFKDKQRKEKVEEKSRKGMPNSKISFMSANHFVGNWYADINVKIKRISITLF